MGAYAQRVGQVPRIMMNDDYKLGEGFHSFDMQKGIKPSRTQDQRHTGTS